MNIRKFVIFILFSCIAISVFADTPPSWQENTYTSKNGQYTAKLYRENKNIQPWKDKWHVKIFNKNKKAIWESKFSHDGYADGDLSNDGKCLIIINFWYHKDGSIITIYRKESIKRILGKEIIKDDSSLPNTASHKIWFNESIGFIGDKYVLRLFDDTMYSVKY